MGTSERFPDPLPGAGPGQYETPSEFDRMVNSQRARSTRRVKDEAGFGSTAPQRPPPEPAVCPTVSYVAPVAPAAASSSATSVNRPHGSTSDRFQDFVHNAYLGLGESSLLSYHAHVYLS